MLTGENRGNFMPVLYNLSSFSEPLADEDKMLTYSSKIITFQSLLKDQLC